MKNLNKRKNILGLSNKTISAYVLTMSGCGGVQRQARQTLILPSLRGFFFHEIFHRKKTVAWQILPQLSHILLVKNLPPCPSLPPHPSGFKPDKPPPQYVSFEE